MEGWPTLAFLRWWYTTNRPTTGWMTTNYYVWEDWPGYNDETRSELEAIARTIPENCQGWADVFDQAGIFTGERILIKGTMPQLLEEVG